MDEEQDYNAIDIPPFDSLPNDAGTYVGEAPVEQEYILIPPEEPYDYRSGKKGKYGKGKKPWERDNQSHGNIGSNVMPQNIDAESAVLAAMMLSPEVVEEILAILNPEDFYRPAHRIIFECVKEIFDRNIPIDQLSLADRLTARNELDQVGGKAYVVELAGNSYALVNWKSHAEIVKRCASLRELIVASAGITALAFDAPDDLNSVIERSEKMLLSVTNKQVADSSAQLIDLLDQAYQEIEELSENKRRTTGVLTGFRDIDNVLAGLRPGQMIVIGARPGVGKTSFALNLASNAAKTGTAVGFFSLEMSGVEIGQRLLCAESGVSLQDARTGQIRSTDWPRLIDATTTLSELDFTVDDTPGTTIMEIRTKARRMMRGKKNGLVILDYLQLVSGGGSAENRNVEVAEMSRGIKILAKDLGIPVIALSQLSREVERRTNKRPMLSDLRESGSIEQDADIVMFIDRSTSEEEAEQDGRPDLGMGEIIIAKNRSGPTADIPLAFISERTKFMDLASDV